MKPPAPPPEVVKAAGLVLNYFASILRDAAQPPAASGVAYYTARTSPMSPRAFRRAAAAGAFPTFKVGKKLLARQADVDAWIATQPRRPAVKPDPAAEDDAEFLRAMGLEKVKP